MRHAANRMRVSRRRIEDGRWMDIYCIWIHSSLEIKYCKEEQYSCF